MYKQGVRSMPRCFKRELVLITENAKSINDIVPIEKSKTFSQEEIDRIVKIILSISGLPSFWLVSVPDRSESFSNYLVFEKKLNFAQVAALEAVFDFYNIYVFVPSINLSDYYGIY